MGAARTLVDVRAKKAISREAWRTLARVHPRHVHAGRVRAAGCGTSDCVGRVGGRGVTACIQVGRARFDFSTAGEDTQACEKHTSGTKNGHELGISEVVLRVQVPTRSRKTISSSAAFPKRLRSFGCGRGGPCQEILGGRLWQGGGPHCGPAHPHQIVALSAGSNAT